MDIYQKQVARHFVKPLRAWLWTGMVMVLAMVAIGGITRLTDSGLSMVDWKPIMGAVPPLGQAEWNHAFEQYKGSPQYRELNPHFELADFKRIFWWEYIHRLFGRIIGLVFMLPFGWFLLRGRLSAGMVWRLSILLMLGAAQGLLGWYMVKSGLVQVPRVSHFRLAAHLLTALAAALYIKWLLSELKPVEPLGKWVKIIPFARWNVGLFLLVVLQIAYGAFVAGKDAGHIHNTWPLMDGSFLLAAATGLQPFWLNLLQNNSMLQFIHRSLAIVLLVFVLSLWWESAKRHMPALVIRQYGLLCLAVIGQFILGVITLLLKVPLVTALAHQLLAAVVLLQVVNLLHVSLRKHWPLA
jgi:cytochrome c oxidase assembly protein subunit 15